MAISLVAIPLVLAVILSTCGVEVVRVLTVPNRNMRELFGAGAGLLIGGVVGFMGSALAAFAYGWVPFLGSRGNPAAMAVAILAGIVGLALLGGWLGGAVGRYAPQWGVKGCPSRRQGLKPECFEPFRHDRGRALIQSLSSAEFLHSL